MKKAITRYNYARQILHLPFWSCVWCFFNSNTISVEIV